MPENRVEGRRIESDVRGDTDGDYRDPPVGSVPGTINKLQGNKSLSTGAKGGIDVPVADLDGADGQSMLSTHRGLGVRNTSAWKIGGPFSSRRF